MSYQVLARKWRPATFEQMVGQSHALQALTNALQQQRLHHAYLFTGTRGVGKTSLARLFAKGLNCETGITATPCGQCSSCIEIAQGRFVDLIEVDAASRTKVDDTRELLENVQYRPSRGRFKVYLIDEVHMLSRSSFNALLKTLEEPPEHVKFLLATTDPQKLPVTVLSRCLQFNLKSLGLDDILGQLQHVLTAESIPFDDGALRLIAKSANGSMRDALSLTDQAIAYGAGHVEQAQVQAMLGTLDAQHIQAMLAALIAGDSVTLLTLAAEALSYGGDAGEILRSLLEQLHQIALCQFAPACAQLSLTGEDLLPFTELLSPEQVQLYYQMLLQGRKDLPFAPDPRSGLEMALLRAMMFEPEPDPSGGQAIASSSAAPANKTPGAGKRAFSQLSQQLHQALVKPAATAHSTSASSTVSVATQAAAAITAPSVSLVAVEPVVASVVPSTPAEAQLQVSAQVNTQANVPAPLDVSHQAIGYDQNHDQNHKLHDELNGDAALLAEQALLISQAQSHGYQIDAGGHQSGAAQQAYCDAAPSQDEPALPEMGNDGLDGYALDHSSFNGYGNDASQFDDYQASFTEPAADNALESYGQSVELVVSQPTAQLTEPSAGFNPLDDILDQVLKSQAELLSTIAPQTTDSEPHTSALARVGDIKNSEGKSALTSGLLAGRNKAALQIPDAGSVSDDEAVQAANTNAPAIASPMANTVTNTITNSAATTARVLTPQEVEANRPPWEDAPVTANETAASAPSQVHLASANTVVASSATVATTPAPKVAPNTTQLSSTFAPTGDALDLHWYKQMSNIQVGGRVRQLAVNSICQQWSEDRVILLLKPDQKHLAAANAIEQLRDALAPILAAGLELVIDVGLDIGHETPRELRHRFHRQLLGQARDALLSDEQVQWMQTMLAASLDEDSLSYPGELLTAVAQQIPSLSAPVAKA